MGIYIVVGLLVALLFDFASQGSMGTDWLYSLCR